MLRGAIFDFDGTLFDSMFIWKSIGESYLRSIGYAPKATLNRELDKMDLCQAARYLKREYAMTESVEEIANGVNDMVRDSYRLNILPKPGVADFLQRLYAHGVKMCIATATDRALIQTALSRCKMERYFSEIFTCASVGHGKDEPIIYREALKHLQTEKNHTIVFEDALHAAETVKSDGFITVAVADAYEHKQKEIAALADFYLTDFSDFDSFWKFAATI